MSEFHFTSRPTLKLFSSSVEFDAEAETVSTGPTGTSVQPSSQRRERELDRISGAAKPKTMAVRFGTFARLLKDATEDDCTWLEDFAEDTVQIDADLHEVMLAYQDLRRRKAA